MEDKSLSKSKRLRHLDRVTLDGDSISRLDAWIITLSEKYKGIKVSRKDLINWLINEHTPELNLSEEKKLKEKFYDDELFLEYALDQIKEARLKGKSVTLKEIQEQNKINNCKLKPKKSISQKQINKLSSPPSAG